MRDLPWLLAGGAAVAYFWSRSRQPRVLPVTGPLIPTGAPVPISEPPVGKLPGRWVWPVPMWNGRKPDISSGWGSPRDGGKRLHKGADIMYHRVPGDPFPIGPNGSKGYVMPDDMVAVAAADGKVWSTALTSRGNAVVIDHGQPSGLTTFYQHLSSLLVTPTQRGASGQRVTAGQPIGIIGESPRDPHDPKHLHFEIRRGVTPMDPKPIMCGKWEFIPDPRTARNSGLAYRSLGAAGEHYPNWVRALDGKSGVYVIREHRSNGDPEVVYVGSSRGRLYDTLTRHFQSWRRYKGFWRGQYAEGHDPGLTYDRRRVDVAVRLTSPGDALDEEARLIERLRPRDNVLMQPTDDVPF